MKTTVSSPAMRTILPSLLIAAILYTGCNQTEVQCHWATSPLQVDGQMEDWTNLPKTYFEDLGASLGISNDTHNLYILFRFQNRQWLPLLHQNGLTIWLDKTAEKKKDFGIRYFAKLPLDSTRIRQTQNPQWSGPASRRPPNMQQIEQRAVEEIIILNDDLQLNSIPPDGSYGINASFGIIEGISTYELSVPLPKTDPLKYAIGTQPGQKISLGVEIAAVEPGGLDQMPGGRSGGMPPSGGIPPGGKIGPGMGGGKPPTPQMPKGEKLWVKTTLAKPPAQELTGK
jgi:hypothetical protein